MQILGTYTYNGYPKLIHILAFSSHWQTMFWAISQVLLQGDVIANFPFQRLGSYWQRVSLGQTKRERNASFFKLPPRTLSCYKRWKKYNRAWSSMTNFVDGFQDLSKDSCCEQGEGLITTSTRQCFEGIWCCHNDHPLNSFRNGSIKFLN